MQCSWPPSPLRADLTLPFLNCHCLTQYKACVRVEETQKARGTCPFQQPWPPKDSVGEGIEGQPPQKGMFSVISEVTDSGGKSVRVWKMEAEN